MRRRSTSPLHLRVTCHTSASTICSPSSVSERSDGACKQQCDIFIIRVLSGAAEHTHLACERAYRAQTPGIRDVFARAHIGASSTRPSVNALRPLAAAQLMATRKRRKSLGGPAVEERR